MRGLDGKTAVVTGGATLIGQAVVRAFREEGTNVAAADVDEEGARSLRDDVLFVPTDLRDDAAIERFVAATADRFGGIDVLVNNAASTARGYLEDVSVELWDEIMHVNLRAPFLCLQEAVKSMKARGGGSIVNVGSVNAYIGEPKLGPYSVSKGGMMTLTRNAASTLNRYRIRVNQINVGWTLTEGEDRVKRAEGKGSEWLDEAVRTRPFGRLLSPHDVALAAAYFASDDSALVTGAVMDLEQYPVGAPPNW